MPVTMCDLMFEFTNLFRKYPGYDISLFTHAHTNKTYFGLWIEKCQNIEKNYSKKLFHPNSPSKSVGLSKCRFVECRNITLPLYWTSILKHLERLVLFYPFFLTILIKRYSVNIFGRAYKIKLLFFFVFFFVFWTNK